MKKRTIKGFNYPIVKTFDDVKKRKYRDTLNWEILGQIPIWFSRSYVHSLNKVLWTRFISDISHISDILKDTHDYLWETTFENWEAANKIKCRILNKCLVESPNYFYFMEKYYKLVMENLDCLIKL